MPVTVERSVGIDREFYAAKLLRLAHEADARALQPVLTLAQSVHPLARTEWHAVTLTDQLVIGNIECAAPEDAAVLAALALDADLEVFLDAAQKSPQSQAWRELFAGEPRLRPYSDLAVWAEAIVATVLQLATPGPLQEAILVGAGPLCDALQHRLIFVGYDVSRAHAVVGSEPGTPLLIGASFHTPVVTPAMLEAIARDGVTPLCIDGGIGTFAAEALAVARAQGWPVRRPDMRAALSAQIQQLRQYQRLIEELQGTREIAGVECVAGGFLGGPGAIVLDRLDLPSTILGWADGQGGLLRESADARWLADRAAVAQALGIDDAS